MPGDSPYALLTPVFPFRSLALLAGRAPLGGPRETALATLVAARLTSTTAGPRALPAAMRTKRAEAARQWMGSVALPSSARTALERLMAATAEDDVRATHAALVKVTDVTAATLDRAARAELDRLAARILP